MESRETIIESIRKAYSIVDNCLLHSSNNERVVDDPIQKSVFDPNQIKLGFDVNNPNHHSFSLLQIDGKLMNSDIRGLKQCDCAVVCDGEISFVEFKMGAVTKDMNNNCQDAESQLFMTMMRMSWTMRRVGKDLLDLARIDGYVCLPSYPKANVNFQNRQLKFLKKTGVKLYYSNNKNISANHPT